MSSHQPTTNSTDPGITKQEDNYTGLEERQNPFDNLKEFRTNELIKNKNVLDRKKYKQEILNHLNGKYRGNNNRLIPFPLGSTNLEIPIDFQPRQENTSLNNPLNSYIGKNRFTAELKQIPVLHLDLSDKRKEDLAIMSYQIEQMTQELNEKNKRIRILEEQIKQHNEEVIRD